MYWFLSLYLLTGCLHVYLSRNKNEESLDKRLVKTFQASAPVLILAALALLFLRGKISIPVRNIVIAGCMGSLIVHVYLLIFVNFRNLVQWLSRKTDDEEQSTLLPQ